MSGWIVIKGWMDGGTIGGGYNNGFICSLKAFINIKYSVEVIVLRLMLRERVARVMILHVPWGRFLLHLIFDPHGCLRGSDALGMIIGGWGEGKR